jgi:hypothetical protein
MPHAHQEKLHIILNKFAPYPDFIAITTRMSSLSLDANSISTFRISYLQEQGHKIILTLDSNDSYDPDTTHTPHPLLYAPHKPTLSTTHDGKLATLIASCGLIDPLAHQHSSRPFPAVSIQLIALLEELYKESRGGAPDGPICKSSATMDERKDDGMVVSPTRNL